MGLLTCGCLPALDSVGEIEAVTAAGIFGPLLALFFADAFEFAVECECDDEEEDDDPDMTEFVMGNSSSLMPFNTIGYN